MCFRLCLFLIDVCETCTRLIIDISKNEAELFCGEKVETLQRIVEKLHNRSKVKQKRVDSSD
jgi:hypothetical protein